MTEQLIKILRDVSNSVPKSADENLFDSGMLDSFRMAKVIAEIEEAFSIEIEIDDIAPENFVSVHKISELIAERKRKQNEN